MSYTKSFLLPSNPFYMNEHYRPFLKWAGSKFNCLHHILDALPDGNCLIEPFGGSGSVFINTNYPRYIISEINPDLILLYSYLQHEGEPFIVDCNALFTPENNTPEQYYHLRQAFNECTEPRRRATLFVYLNRHGYNGLCRYNQKGGYNVPFGSYVDPKLPQLLMQHFRSKSQNATFHHLTFQETFALAKPGDVIYCDPPYAPINQVSNFSSYMGTDFKEEEHRVLASQAEEAAAKGITVVISNHDTAFTRALYSNGTIKSFMVSRFISRTSENRTPVNELVAVFKPD